MSDAESDAAIELADKVARATKELIRAGGDASMLLPEEVDVLIEYGCAEWEDDRLLLTTDWAETFNRAWNGPPPVTVDARDNGGLETKESDQ